MRIEKSKIAKALKQLGIFVKKGGGINPVASLVHFHNEGGKATVYATDCMSAGRVRFETGTDEGFDFCVKYEHISQAVRMRGKDIDMSIRGEKEIVFSDGRTEFRWPLSDPDEIVSMEEATVVPEGEGFSIKAGDLQKAIKAAGYARNEKETERVYVTGVYFRSGADGVFMASTDHHRCACWKSDAKGIEMSGILSAKVVAAIDLYDKDDEMSIHVTDDKVVLVSGNFEAYATKINSEFVDVEQGFSMEVVGSYDVSCKDMAESLGIIDRDVKKFSMRFCEDDITLKAVAVDGVEQTDHVPCSRIDGPDGSVSVDIRYVRDILANVDEERIVFELRKFRDKIMCFAYRAEGGEFGIIAPRRSAGGQEE